MIYIPFIVFADKWNGVMKVLYVIAFVLLGMATVVSAQENGNIEQLLDANDVVRSDEQYEDMLAVLQKLWMAPLNLNTADFDSLKLLFFSFRQSD